MGETLSGLWAQAPAVTRSLVVLPLTLHVAGFVWGPFLQNALDLSLMGFRRGNFWTLLTPLLWEPPGSLLSTLFALLLAYFVLSGVPTLERAEGSGRFLCVVASSSVAINIAFLLLAQLLDMIWRALGWLSLWPLVPCHGMMPLAVFAMSARCFAAPEGEAQFFGFRIRNKYYPLVLVAIFGLVSGPAVLQDVAALIIGKFYEKPLQLRWFLPSEATVMRWESSGMRCLFGRHLFGGRWVSVGEASGGSGLVAGPGLPGAGQGYTMLGRPQARPAAPVASEFRVFAGRGQRLGHG